MAASQVPNTAWMLETQVLLNLLQPPVFTFVHGEQYSFRFYYMFIFLLVSVNRTRNSGSHDPYHPGPDKLLATPCHCFSNPDS
jgi:hypothetical protein